MRPTCLSQRAMARAISWSRRGRLMKFRPQAGDSPDRCACLSSQNGSSTELNERSFVGNACAIVTRDGSYIRRRLVHPEQRYDRSDLTGMLQGEGVSLTELGQLRRAEHCQGTALAEGAQRADRRDRGAGFACER